MTNDSYTCAELRIYTEINTRYQLGYWLFHNLWAGAKQRWDDGSDEQRLQVVDRILEYFEDASDVEINDFVWFDCDDIWFPDEEADFTDLNIGEV